MAHLPKDGPAYDFLHAYGSHQEFFLSLPVLWKVQFFYPQWLVYAINNALSKNRDEFWRAERQPLDYIDREGGILAARQVVVPNENTSFDVAGGMNLGGFLPGYATNKRMDFLQKNLVINFFDTQDDIEHLFFRPWMIAISIDGLMERNLLCPTVRLTQYNNLMQIRKGYEFTDVFPTNVEGYTLNYDSTDFIEKSVTFAFRNYRPITRFSRAIPVPGESSSTSESGPRGPRMRRVSPAGPQFTGRFGRRGNR
jgi:hypothetical protein